MYYIMEVHTCIENRWNKQFLAQPSCRLFGLYNSNKCVANFF